MKIDIRILVTFIYFLINYLSFKFADDTGYVPDIMPAFVLLTSTIVYLIFWIFYLIIAK